MKNTSIIKRCNATEATIHIFDGVQKHLMAYDECDFYHLFRSTTSTYALRYKFTSKINSTKKLLSALNSIEIKLKGRDTLIHIIYPEGVDSEMILASMEIIQSSYQTPDKEVICIPTKRRKLKFWQVKLYLFDEYLVDRYYGESRQHLLTL